VALHVKVVWPGLAGMLAQSPGGGSRVKSSPSPSVFFQTISTFSTDSNPN
jgi:hypothetical protein